MAQATGQSAFPLTPYSNDEFRFEQAGIVITFDRAAQPVSFTLHQGGGRYAYRRADD
jgi:D-alanyl-D-alanine carboxypeptidase